MRRTRYIIAFSAIQFAAALLLAFDEDPLLPDREKILLQGARNSARAGNYDLAMARFQEYLTLQPGDGEAALELAGLLTRFDRQEEAERICTAVVTELTRLHRAHPNDITVLRQLSRLARWLMRYREAAQWYELYLKLEPKDKEARLEQARLAGWDLRYADAERYYESMIADFPEEKSFRFELQAKHNNWLGRPRKASRYYSQALAVHPDDTELLFDLGQMYSRRNLSHRAEEQYERVLELAPDHSMAARAISAEQWRRKQHVRLEQSYLHKEGRGREVDITQFRTDLKYSPQRLAEGLDVSVAVGQSFFSFDLKPEIDPAPTLPQKLLDTAGLAQAARIVGFLKQLEARRRFRHFDSHSPATHFTLGFDQHFDTGIRAWADVELTVYDQRPHQTIQYDAGISYRIKGALEIALLGGLQDVMENFFTLHEGLSRYYIGSRFNWQPLMRAGCSGQVRGFWYNDGNQAIDYDLQGYYLLSTYPKILKLVGKIYGFHVDENRFDYWTPLDYWQTQVGLSWHHYLNQWHFEGSERLYYYLEGFAGLDNDGEQSIQGKAGLVWDSQKRWKIGIEAGATHSDVYEEQRGTLYLEYTW